VQVIAPKPEHHKLIKFIGWVIAVFGMGLCVFGYFIDGSAVFIDWPRYLPGWVADYIPNLEVEIGFALSMIGMVPIYYVAFLESKEADRGVGD